MTDLERHEARQELYASLIKLADHEAQSARDYKVKRAKAMQFASQEQMEKLADDIKKAGHEASALDDFRLTLESLKNDEEEIFNDNGG